MADTDAAPVEDCPFCGIAAGTLPRQIRYEDDEIIVFRNALTWAPVMYLAAPRVHMSQAEWWQSPLFPRAARLAIEIAKEEAPGGFRLVSNFGDDAMQSQLHGHLHVLGGVHLGLYMDFPRKGDFWLRNYGYTERVPREGVSGAGAGSSIVDAPSGGLLDGHSDASSQAISDAPPLAPGEPRP